MSKFTAEQIEAAARARDQYREQIQYLWEDTLFEVSMKLGLRGKEVEELMGEMP